jgi:hypothetical protein
MNGSEMFIRTRPPAAEPRAQTIEPDIDDRRGVEREQLADEQPADDGNRAAGAVDPLPPLNASGHRAEQRRHRGHHDRAEPQPARLIDRFLWCHAVLPLGDQREVDHHGSRSSSRCRSAG